jgi:N-acetylmuramoyl-L-alanine amidase
VKTAIKKYSGFFSDGFAFFCAAILLISVFNTPAFSAGAESARLSKVTVTEIKHWSNPDYTRIVISLSSSAKFTHKLLKQDETLKKPRRLFIDIAGATLDKALPKEIPINDGLLKTARAGQFDKETVRVVLDIESIEDYKVIPFEDPFRIVIDVTGKQAAIQKSAEVKTTPAQPQPKAHTPKKAIRVVIDPGHGGKDPGAIGKSGLREKDVTLKITKLLKRYPEMSIIMALPILAKS